ncbi:hypothetical protein [Methylobacterium sp. E-066]|uniref:hypothetical protein n=1 Tax=Methylobacterium sp. E-066 TaxID=2836584 RepID=UPI001FB8F1FF|nr:hypothetical protein [Methylobacterium sp. E-066]MCJ2143733.1 hypothetical protein [Methylobacterium sp. E-066]
MPFEDEWLARQGELDAAFSEDFILEPQAPPDLPSRPGRGDVNARAVSSSARPALPFTGTFVDAGATLHAHGRRMADSASHGIAAERPMIDVPEAALPQRPQVGDIIRRLKTGAIFTVQAYLPEAPVRAWIYLAEGERRQDQPR